MRIGRLFSVAFLIVLTGLTPIYNCSAQISPDQKLDCFSIVAGKNATIDGSVIFAHNEDTGLKLVNLYKVPETKNKPGAQIILRQGGVVPQADVTAGFLWVNIPGLYVCDSYLNENGVAIASDGCPSREKNPELNDGGIVYWLRRIVAQRASTAKEGVKIAGKLIDQFGYASSGRTYILADGNEGWILAVVNGKHWVAQRVPDDEIAVIPNCYTIGNIDLSDTVNFLGSPDIIDYARKQGWFDPENDEEFNFANSYSSPGSLRHPGNVNRWWRGISLVSGKEFDLDDKLPFSVKPQQKVSFQDIMSVLRDHYEGTELDKSCNYTLGSPYKMNGATICSGGTQYSSVVQLRNWLPPEIGSTMWLALYRPDVQAYVPWYAGIEKVPEIYGLGDYQFALMNQFDPADNMFDRNNNVSFWTFVELTGKVEKNYGEYAPLVQKKWRIVEQKSFRNQEMQENKFLEIYKQDPDKALNLITDYSDKSALYIYRQAGRLVRQKQLK